MGGRLPEGHVTDLRNTRMVETSIRQRRMEEWRLLLREARGRRGCSTIDGLEWNGICIKGRVK